MYFAGKTAIWLSERYKVFGSVAMYHQVLHCKRKSHPRFVWILAMCYNLCIETESLGYCLRLSVIWRL